MSMLLLTAVPAVRRSRAPVTHFFPSKLTSNCTSRVVSRRRACIEAGREPQWWGTTRHETLESRLPFCCVP